MHIQTAIREAVWQNATMNDKGVSAGSEGGMGSVVGIKDGNSTETTTHCTSPLSSTNNHPHTEETQTCAGHAQSHQMPVASLG